MLLDNLKKKLKSLLVVEKNKFNEEDRKLTLCSNNFSFNRENLINFTFFKLSTSLPSTLSNFCSSLSNSPTSLSLSKSFASILPILPTTHKISSSPPNKIFFETHSSNGATLSKPPKSF